MRFLEEKLAIKELEQKLKMKTKSIEKLEARVNDLEQRLNASGEFSANSILSACSIMQSWVK
ncbi:MAG: hypothetical protein RMJ03_01715 [Nitrososphaerota archaeon]|nr:hypothetical protein [Nitrososphaerota archaeon]